ncbi:substrate-binding domain-containing protein [Cohnella hongkongensis]|uniref:Substrate-binding domain-containing protein n=1 Tax=Cohnella hongkongensis TaxID=178337 RepID=A0ABV9FFL0_9BACL
MKRIAIFLLAGVVALLAACSKEAPSSSQEPSVSASSPEGAGAEGEKNYHFVFIPKVVHPWYDAVETGAKKAAEELKSQGINVKIEFDAPPQADVVLHAQKIESVVSKKPDAIAVAVLDDASDSAVINDATKAGAKIITFDTDAPDSSRLMYVGHDKNEEDGAMLAALLAQKMNEEGEVAILVGSLSAPNHSQRVAGFKKQMANYPNIKIVEEQADNDDLEKAVSLTESILQAHPNVKGFFGSNASNPIGIARAVKDSGNAGNIFIVGMDDLPETIEFINEGVITGTVVQNVSDIGYNSVKYMVDILEGKEVPETVPTGSYVVTKDNMDEYLSKTGQQ